MHSSGGGVVLWVMDPTGALIPNAQVKLLSDRGIEIHMDKTNRRGRLRLTGFSTGSYVIEVVMRGFRTCRETVKIKSWTLNNVELKLELASVSAPVEVLAASIAEVDVLNVPPTTLQMVPYQMVPSHGPQVVFALTT